jgi:hexosaminidase
MCPEQQVYLDHRQADGPDEPIPVGYVRTLDDVYRYEPVPEGLAGTADARRVLGTQAQVWTEHLDSARRIDYAAFPRLAAFAEVAWTPPELRDLTGFQQRLHTGHLPRLDALGVEYRPLDGPAPWQRRPGVQGRPHAGRPPAR